MIKELSTVPIWSRLSRFSAFEKKTWRRDTYLSWFFISVPILFFNIPFQNIWVSRLIYAAMFVLVEIKQVTKEDIRTWFLQCDQTPAR